MFSPSVMLDLGAFAADTSILASVAIILGAVFVVYQIRQDDKMIQATIKQADANAEQAKLTMKQVVQNSELATVDLVMRIYEFADSIEVQRSYLTVIQSRISSFEDFERLPEEKQLAFLQIASLFESLGFLVEKGYVRMDIVDDMFATKVAWEATNPFILGMRKRYSTEDYYFFFERLYTRLLGNDTGSITAEFLTKRDSLGQPAADGPKSHP